MEGVVGLVVSFYLSGIGIIAASVNLLVRAKAVIWSFSFCVGDGSVACVDDACRKNCICLENHVCA